MGWANMTLKKSWRILCDEEKFREHAKQSMYKDIKVNISGGIQIMLD